MMFKSKKSDCVLELQYGNKFADEEARLNFLGYALTSYGMCKGHSLSEEYRKRLLQGLSRGEKIEDHVEDEFFNAVVNLERLSKSKGNNVITTETIDDYFLGPLHNNYASCHAKIGTVKSSNGKNAIVTVQGKTAEFDTILAPSLKHGDKAIVHGKYVVKGIKK
jgi:hypothetical protein